MRTLALIAAAVLLLAVSASAATSGLHGLVTRGPTTPVCQAELPCGAPAANLRLTFTRLGHSWTTKTDAHGRYRIGLHPGTYRVTTTLRPSPPAWHATVPAGHVAVHDFQIDTSIR
jgi:hypothetical protein